MRVSTAQQGFALPTILIASVVMLIVLVSAVSASASIRTALDTQQYTQLAREAAESGIVRAIDCLKGNNYTPPWTGSSSTTLRPGSPCTGSSYATCTASGNCFLVEMPNYRTGFDVGETFVEGDSRRVRARGYVQLMRPGETVSWRVYESTTTARVGSASSGAGLTPILYGF